MNTIQKKYIRAKVIYDEICKLSSEKTDRTIKNTGLDENDEKNDDAIVDIIMENEKEFGKHEAMIYLSDVEEELLEWGKSKTVQNINDYAEYKPHADKILTLWEKTNRLFVRTKLIDLTLKLAG